MHTCVAGATVTITSDFNNFLRPKETSTITCTVNGPAIAVSQSESSLLLTSTMNLAEKQRIGQHFVFGFHGHSVSSDIRTLIEEYHVGSVILMKRNIVDFAQTRALIRELQTLARDAGHAKPLLIGIDQENGLVAAFCRPGAGTQFPGAMALAATGSPSIAEQVSFASGRELRLAGITWAYSPVADVNSDSRNPVIGVRSFGDDPQQVGIFASAVAKGLAAAGVAPCAKHFPGHGDTAVDSHLALPRIMKSRAALQATELPPFEALVAQGVASIMTGHMALPAVTGSDAPCSLARAITTDLLRGALGFRGLVVTDCLEMDAISDTAQGACGVEEGAVRALGAGADVVMICHTMAWQRGAVLETYNAVRSGRLVLDESHIDALKDKFAGTWDDVLSDRDDLALEWENAKRESVALSDKAYKLSTALVNGADTLPLKTGQPVALFTPPMESLNKAVDDADGVLRTKSGALRNTAGPSFLAFAESVGKRAPCTHAVYQRDAALSVPADCAAVIFTLRNADRSPWQLDSLRMLAESVQVPIIVVGSCAPYEAASVVQPYVACFEYTPAALEGAARSIFGEQGPAHGTVPVKY
ncbi:glycoside hydrolase family 3 protein [Mycena belliarum]|uniref:Glycoside hydrolase family 3 protein n=1 Tax=Mycena belliarum TaxID=1033014 RepID=A0AAD6U6C9_9AGAR|nr:glycoside hydrolase family 3 protein [Mycena belliae]